VSEKPITFDIFARDRASDTFGKVGKSAGSMGDKFAKVAKLAAVGVAAIGTAALGVTVGLAKLGESFDTEFDKIRTGTGATGGALKGLEGSFKNVLSSVPASFADAGTAIADINTRLGLTGKPLEDLSGQFINLSRITKTDLSTNVDNITRAFGDWGVSAADMAPAMDKIYRASQSSGIGIDDLSKSVVQFGAPLRNLGFDMDSSLALLAQFNKTGVNTETVFAGLKAGVGKLAKAGEAVPETFKRVTDEITKLGPGSEATAKAIELFGQRAGPDLADAIAGGKFELGGMLDAITNGTDTINGAAKDTESFKEKWLLLKNRVFVGLQPVATKLFDLLGTGMDKLGELAQDVFPMIKQLATILFKGDFKGGPFSEDSKIVDVFFDIREAAARFGKYVVGTLVPTLVRFGQTVYEKVVLPLVDFGRWVVAHKPILIGLATAIGVGLTVAMLTYAAAATEAAYATLLALAPYVAIGAAIAAVTAGVVYAYQNWGWFHDAVDAVVRFFKEKLLPAIGSVVSFIIDTFIPAVVGISNSFADAGAWVGRKVGEIVGFITSIPGKIARTVSGMWDGITNGIKSAVSFVGDRIGDLLGAVGRLPGQISSAASGMWDGFKNAFKNSLNWIIDKWNGLSFTIPGFSVPGLGKVGGSTISVPKIPRFHDGGIFQGIGGRPEGLALLKSGERVLSPQQTQDYDSGKGRGLNVAGDLVLGSRDDIPALDFWARTKLAGV